MQHDDQHRAAISPTVRVRNEVSCTIFSDKVKEMGTVRVESGRIEIKLDFLPSMISDDAVRDMTLDSIRLGLEACWAARAAVPETTPPLARRVRDDRMRSSIAPRAARLVPRVDTIETVVATVRFHVERGDHQIERATADVERLRSELAAAEAHLARVRSILTN